MGVSVLESAMMAIEEAEALAAGRPDGMTIAEYMQALRECVAALTESLRARDAYQSLAQENQSALGPHAGAVLRDQPIAIRRLVDAVDGPPDDAVAAAYGCPPAPVPLGDERTTGGGGGGTATFNAGDVVACGGGGTSRSYAGPRRCVVRRHDGKFLAVVPEDATGGTWTIDKSRFPRTLLVLSIED
jgi:hypothetical protein